MGRGVKDGSLAITTSMITKLIVIHFLGKKILLGKQTRVFTYQNHSATMILLYSYIKTILIIVIKKFTKHLNVCYSEDL